MRTNSVLLTILTVGLLSAGAGCEDQAKYIKNEPIPEPQQTAAATAAPPPPAPTTVAAPGAKPLPPREPTADEKWLAFQEKFVELYRKNNKPRMAVMVRPLDAGRKTTVVDVVPEHTTIEQEGQAVTIIERNRRGRRRRQIDVTGGAARRTDDIGYQPREVDYIDEKDTRAIDYEMMITALVDFLECDGEVNIIDTEMVDAVVDRETALRADRNDKQALSLIKTKLGADIAVIENVQTSSQAGISTRMVCKAVRTDDARVIGRAYVDLREPLTKRNLRKFSRYLAFKLMEDMTKRWEKPYTTISVKIFKAISIEQVMVVRSYLKRFTGVTGVYDRQTSLGGEEAVAELEVEYEGAAADLFTDLADEKDLPGFRVAGSDVTLNTLSLEMVDK